MDHDHGLHLTCGIGQDCFGWHGLSHVVVLVCFFQEALFVGHSQVTQKNSASPQHKQRYTKLKLAGSCSRHDVHCKTVKKLVANKCFGVYENKGPQI